MRCASKLKRRRSLAFHLRSSEKSEVLASVARRPTTVLDRIGKNATIHAHSSSAAAVQGTLDSYNAGINVVRVNFDRADPPSEVIDSFREVQAAQQERDRLEKEADAYDKLLDTADELMTLLAGAPVALEPDQQESLAFYLAEQRDVLQNVLRGDWVLDWGPDTSAAVGTASAGSFAP